MKYLTLIIGIVLLAWGAWVIGADRPSEYRDSALAACKNITFDNAMDGLKCDSSSLKSAEDLERNATIAVVVGFLSSGVGMILFKRSSSKK